MSNAFSKKAENHAQMMAIYFMHYNFVRIHQSLRITPTMQATKMGKLHSNLAKAAFRPAEQVTAMQWHEVIGLSICALVCNRPLPDH